MTNLSPSMPGLQPAITSVPSRNLLRSFASNVALAAALTVSAMFSIFLFTGIGQDPLQFVHSPQEYLSILLRNPPVLQFSIGLDNLFIVLYSSMFLAICISLWNVVEYKALLAVSCALLGLAGMLDLIENMHFMTMIAAAKQGMDIGASQIELQVWESLLKFHVSYLGLFLMGFALPSNTWLESALCVALRWVQLPVGLLIYLVPREVSVPLVMVRFTFFFLALLAFAAIFRRSKFD